MKLAQSPTSLQWLQDWYRLQCNETWEHEHGISISTLDNPGWSVVIDLVGTDLAGSDMSPYTSDPSDTDWVFCKLEAGKFTAHGDPSKLDWIIDHFRTWAQTQVSGCSNRGRSEV